VVKIFLDNLMFLELEMSLEALVEISRYYGKNPDYVLAGGGNTSWKDGETLYVKASGTSLAEAVPDSFVKMDRKALAMIWEKQYPESSDERESAVLADLMAARKAGEEKKRPSVETLLHDILPFAFVVHLHPALVNGLTCSRQGEKAAEEIFGNDAVWIAPVNPGYELSKIVKTAIDAYKSKNGKAVAVIFLQNHGVFVGDNSAESVKEIYGVIMNKIGARIKRRPDFSDEKILSIDSQIDPQISDNVKTLADLAGSAVLTRGGEISALVKDRASFAPVSSAFTPDHIVYAGSEPLFTEANTSAGIRDEWKKYVDKTGRKPKIVAVQGLGVFCVGASEKAAFLALELFRDAIKVAVYSRSFGGPLFMTEDKIDFINNWEVERYRANVSAK
jgi:rhamnose utilization protein RhaD (predicted bifunctional aldolase and dehydrogenase)